MNNETRTPDEIERDILDERSRMSESINTLQKKFSVEAIVGDVGEMFRTQGGELGRSISQTVGRNPAAVALVGVGLAWLFLGKSRNGSTTPADDVWGDRMDRMHNRGTTGSWERQGQASSGRNKPYWYDYDQMSNSRLSDARGLAGDPSDWVDPDTATGVVGAVKGAAHAVGDAVSGAAGSVGRAASDLSARLMHGLEDLSEDARSRVVAARRAAHDARMASGAAMKRGAEVATNFFDDQPLVVGALAVAVGAAMGGILPHTRVEDETLGASSDRLFADAQALFREERDKAMAAVKAAAADMTGEIKDAGSELAQLLPEGKNVGEVIVDRAADAASRVYDRALGKGEPNGSSQG